MTGSTILSAIAAAALSNGVAPVNHPIMLNVDFAADPVVVQVVGVSAFETRATYELELVGGAPGSRNRSVQRGTALLQPGRKATLATVKLSMPTGGAWDAKLHVTPEGGASYDLEWNSAR